MEVKQKAARLAQLRRIRREVDLLSQWIAELELAANGGDRVTGLPGRPPEGASAQLNRLWRQLERRRRRCLQLLGALYTFIDEIDDSLIRQIVSYRYIDGLTWREIAVAIGGRDEQYPRRLHNRFLARTPLSPGDEFDDTMIVATKRCRRRHES